jgi:hypothetical protein
VELINTELNKEDALKNISLKIEALNHLNKPESVFLCQTLNGQIQDFNNLSLDEDLTEIIHLLIKDHNDMSHKLNWGPADINGNVRRIYLLTLPIIKKNSKDAFNWFRLENLKDARLLNVMALKSKNNILYIIDV